MYSLMILKATETASDKFDFSISVSKVVGYGLDQWYSTGGTRRHLRGT